MTHDDRSGSRRPRPRTWLKAAAGWLILLLLFKWFGRHGPAEGASHLHNGTDMTPTDSLSPRPDGRRIWLNAGIIWLILLALFGINTFLAFIPLGRADTAVHMSFAVVMILLLLLFFMDFRKYTALLKLTACGGLFWLLLMFVLTAADYATRF